MTQLPTTSQGPVGLDQAERDLAARLSQEVLCLHQGLLQLGDPREIDGPRLVLGHDNLDGFLEVLNACRLEPGLVLRAVLGFVGAYFKMVHDVPRSLGAGQSSPRRRSS